MVRKIFFGIAALFLLQGAAHAEYNASKLGEGAGSYLYVTQLMIVMQNSNCGYAVKKNYSLAPVLKDIRSQLRPKPLKEFDNFVENNLDGLKVDAKKFVGGFLKAARTDGVDERTACGMLIQNVAIQFGTAKKKWEYAKKNYSK